MHNTSLAKFEYYFHLAVYYILIIVFLKEFMTTLFNTTESSTLADFGIYLLLFLINFVFRVLAKNDMKKGAFLKITNKGVYLYLESGEHVFIEWDNLGYILPRKHSFFKEGFVITFKDVNKIKGLDHFDEKRFRAILEYKKMYFTRQKFFDSYTDKMTRIYLTIACDYAPEYIERIHSELDNKHIAM